MKRLAAISVLCLLFSTAFVAGKGPVTAPQYPDSLRSVYLYTDAVKKLAIDGDTQQARKLLSELLAQDSTYAPAYYELAANGLYDTPEEGVEYARRAYWSDTTNKWYLQFYGQALVYAQRYDEALKAYGQLLKADPQNADNYRILALLYQERSQPYSAISVLDSAELRFGRIPILSTMKRSLLVATRQTDKALAEAQALVDAAPYEAEYHAVLGDLYGIMGKDSLARAEFDRAMQIDSTNLETLMTLSDYYSSRQDYRNLLSVTRNLFDSREMPLDQKIRRFEQLIANRDFYRQHYTQLNILASTLAIRHPNDKRVVDLYANHLIASGELQHALSLYKLHLSDQPPVLDYYRSVVDIESYLQRPDSVDIYVDRALRLFPDNIEFHIAKGNVLGQSKRYTDALKVYRNSLKFAKTDSLRSVIWGIIGDTWHLKAEQAQPDADGTFEKTALNSAARKAMKECYKAYDRSQAYDKNNALVLNNYAYFLAEEERDLEKALEMSSRALALTDNNPTYLDTHAWVLFKLGRTTEARKIMQQALAFDSRNSAELMVHYGDILWALGEKHVAQIYWRKALENGYNAEAIERRIEISNKK